jgi:hypothetical protein
MKCAFCKKFDSNENLRNFIHKDKNCEYIIFVCEKCFRRLFVSSEPFFLSFIKPLHYLSLLIIKIIKKIVNGKNLKRI